jgi:tetratricopeptide (TPR) repeat protein
MTAEQQNKGLIFVLCLFLIINIVVIYWQATGFDFVDYDDLIHVVDNPMVPGGVTWSGLKWAFTTTHTGYWSPVTWISFMLDRDIFGMSARGFHLTNVILHVINSLLLFYVLKRYTRALWPSFFVASFFALHPLHVESVVWVTERRDVLSTLFWLLTMLAYISFVEKRTFWRYVMILIFLAIGLMAKPMVVTLPFVFLVMDFWPLNRLWPQVGIGVPFVRLILEKIPLFILSAASCSATFIAQKVGGSVADSSIFPLSYRAGNALVSYCDYIWKMFRPVELAVFYPHPSGGIAGWKIAASATVLLATTILVIFLRRRRYMLAGWLWYLGTLVPVIGLVQVGRQAMADHYTYIPLTGLFIMLVWFVGEMTVKLRYRNYLIGITGSLILVVLSIMAFRQVGYWRDTVTLFTHTAAVTKDNYLAYSLLGARYAHNGDFEKAKSELEKAMKFNVKEADVLYNIANGLALLGRTDESMEYYGRILSFNSGDTDTYIALAKLETDRGDFARATEIYHKGLMGNPQNGDLHGRLGTLFLQMGRVDEAIAELETAVKLKPDSAIYANLGMAVSSKGQVERAIECYQKSIRMDPANAEAHYNLGNIYLAMERTSEAADEYRSAIKAKPGYSKAYGNLGIALLTLGKRDEGIKNFRQAVELDQNNVEARFNFAMALADKGAIDEAIEHLRKVVNLLPANPIARNNLAALLMQKGQIEQAIVEYEQVLKINPSDTIAQEGFKKAKEALVGR